MNKLDFIHLCNDLEPPKQNSNELPFLTVSLALTMNGAIAGVAGAPLKISGEQSNKLVHFLRSKHDAILVSANTVKSDNPLLNVRHIQGKDPDVIILDRTLKTSATARLFEIPYRSVHILTTQSQSMYQHQNIHTIQCNNTIFDLSTVHHWLKTNNYESIFIEAGPQLFKSFLVHGVQRIILSIAPFFQMGLNIYSEQEPLDFESLGYTRLGTYNLDKDIIIIYERRT